jgi:hypothetical protein
MRKQFLEAVKLEVSTSALEGVGLNCLVVVFLELEFITFFQKIRIVFDNHKE